MGKMRRRTGRLICWLLAMAAMSARGSTPAMTTINDVLYRADGRAARGTLLISWPAFTTADGKPVAAGSMDATLGANGEVNLELAPNAGATPAGTYYKVVLKLEDGTSNTEYWVVPASSPTTIAAIRSRLAPSSVAVQTVTREYVDSAVANKANDTAVVHREGLEVINGLKQFTTAPSVPTPQATGDVVNKGYVDAAVVAVGEGSYVRKNGDTMTGPLTLPADPSAPMQASTRHYVDVTAAGLVPNTALSTTPGAGLVPQTGSSAALDLGWLGSSAGSGDQLLGKTGGSSGAAAWWALPTTGSNGCSGSGDKLLYNSTTHALTCGSDQTGGGGVSWPLLPPNDNVSDVGDGTHRLRTLYAGTSISAPKITGISDTGVVTNLNSDLLDGKHASEFLSTLPALTTSALGGVKGTGSGLLCSGSDKMIGFGADGSMQCGPDQSGTTGWPLLPPNDNLSDIGDATHEIRSIYLGTSAAVAGGAAGTLTIKASPSTLDIGVPGKALRLGTFTAGTSGSPGDANFQIFSNSASSFKGSLYFDAGNDSASSVNFRVGQGGTVLSRLSIANNGAATFSNGDVTISGTYKLNTPKIAGVTDTGVVTNLNSDMVDGKHGSEFLTALPALTAGALGGVKGTGSSLQCSGSDKATGFAADGSLQCGPDQSGAASWPLLPPNDNLSDVGDGTHRLRTLYAGTSISTPKITGISDSTVVNNLNSDLLDGKHSSAFAPGGFSSMVFSATPTFDAGAASMFKMTLTGDVTSATLANAAAGQMLSFVLCQDAAGNHNFVWPSNVKGGMGVGAQPSKCSAQAFVYDGTQAWALGVVNQ